MRTVGQLLGALACVVSACGYGSVNPIFPEQDTQSEPGLIGTWEDSASKESATVTAGGATGYVVDYRDSDGKTGRFRARAGRLGRYRALDLEPADLADDLSDTYKSLLLPIHSPIIIDSIGETLQFRFLEGDSIRQFLSRNPGRAAHVVRDDAVLLTGSTAEVRRFLAAMVTRPGVLGELTVWRRRRP